MKQWTYIKGSEKDFEGAPDWATKLIEGINIKEKFFVGEIEGVIQVVDIGSRRFEKFNIGYKHKTIAHRELIEVWNGEGLPPVGAICEWLASGDHDWVKVTVLGHNGDDTWLKPDDGTQSFVVGNAENFRPVQNEREKAIDEIASMIGRGTFFEDAERIYDAGYRKLSAKPGFEWRYVCSTCGCRVEPGEELPHGC
ncbi:TPA: hypothetical protein ACIBVD_001734 [Salmonella enterica subsp. enterica serovar Javiana]